MRHPRYSKQFFPITTRSKYKSYKFNILQVSGTVDFFLEILADFYSELNVLQLTRKYVLILMPTKHWDERMVRINSLEKTSNKEI